jgi:hypothetical protein
MIFLRSLAYRTEKKNISSLEDVTAILDKNSNFMVGKVRLPYMREWQNLYDCWVDCENEKPTEFLKKYFNVTSNTKLHYKIRKDYSLPISSAQGKFLVRRKSWDNKHTYQILNNADPRADQTQLFEPVFNKNDIVLTKGLLDSFVSKNIFLLNSDEYSLINSENLSIDRAKWYEIECPQDIGGHGVSSMYLRVDDNTRPSIKLVIGNPSDDIKGVILKSLIAKPNTVKDIESVEIFSNSTLIYKGSSFNSDSKEQLNNSLARYYETSSN